MFSPCCEFQVSLIKTKYRAMPVCRYAVLLQQGWCCTRIKKRADGPKNTSSGANQSVSKSTCQKYILACYYFQLSQSSRELIIFRLVAFSIYSSAFFDACDLDIMDNIVIENVEGVSQHELAPDSSSSWEMQISFSVKENTRSFVFSRR